MSQDVYTKKTSFGDFYSNQYPQKIKNNLIFTAVFFFVIAIVSLWLFIFVTNEFGFDPTNLIILGFFLIFFSLAMFRSDG